MRYEGIRLLLSVVTIRHACIAGSTPFAGSSAQYQHCTEQEFNQLLSSSFAGDSGESQQVAGLEDHPDLLSLADSVPEAEDLMDQEMMRLLSV